MFVQPLMWHGLAEVAVRRTLHSLKKDIGHWKALPEGGGMVMLAVDTDVDLPGVDPDILAPVATVELAVINV